jgi:hypothetical protein
MVDADSHLKLLTVSILDIYKVFEHIDNSSNITQLHPHKIFGFWVTCGVKMMSFFVVEADGHTSNCLLHL